MAGCSGIQAQTPSVKPAKSDEELLLKLLNTPISVASSKSTTILTAPSTVTVIDRDMIERYNFTSIEEALDMVPGFAVVSTPSKRRSVPTVRGVLQDNYASKVLLLIDDVPTWHGSLGEGATGRVDIADVERIEVLRGPASVLYGSNAYVGTVNLVLRRATGAVVWELQAGAGTESGYVAGGRAFIQSGQLGITLSANRRVQKGVPFDFSDAEGVRLVLPGLR